MSMISRIGRNISRSARSSLLNATIGCDGYGIRTAAIANQSAGFTSRSEQGLGFVNSYFSSIGAGKQANPSFSSVFRPNFANPSFARFFSTDVAEKRNYEINVAKGDINDDDHKNVLRPLSPHLLIYRPQSNSTLSILTRVSGMYLTGISLLFSLGLLKMGSICLTYPSFYQAVFYSSKLTLVSLEIAALALGCYAYHGISHMTFDGMQKILTDYLHNDMTRTMILIGWRLLLLIAITEVVSFLFISN